MSEKNRVLIVDKMHESIVPLLEGAGYVPDYRPNLDRGEILSELPGAVGLIIRSKTVVDQELVDRAPDLKFVARAGAGLDQLDSNYLFSKNLHVLNAPEGNRDAVGEHAMGLLLGLLNNMKKAGREVGNGLWKREENRGLELKGRVVGIFGFGNTGQTFAKKLSGMECAILAYDKYKTGFSNDYVTESDLDEFRKRTEILSIHVPLTEETRYLFTKEELSRYPNLKIVLNTSRGEVLRLADVLEMLDQHKLMGAGLDVLENEKIDKLEGTEKEVFVNLTKKDNVIITPHVAGWTEESYQKINQVLVKKIQDLNLV